MSAHAQRLEEFWTAMGAGDLDAAADLYAADASVDLSGLVLEGRDAVLEHMKSFRRSFPDASYTVHERLDVGSGRVLEEWSCTATHGGEFLGSRPTGATIRLKAATLYEFADDRVARERSYMDMSRTMLKTGVLQRAGGE